MKKIFTLLYLSALSLFIFNSSNAQVNQWVWLHGSSSPNSAPKHGMKGVAAGTNEPPAVYEPCQWQDTAGYFWFYGGIDSTGLSGLHDDLWRYNPTTNQWTWMKGDSGVNNQGVYGVKGVPSLANTPPSITFGVPTWVDLNNNLWMYGGSGEGNTDDLWRYNIATNEWTWMKGEDSLFAKGVYGIQGMPDTANHPPAKSETAAAWTDSAGDLWLFGGEGATQGAMNDLWRFNIATNTWTWMKGSNQGGLFGKYGTQGVEKSTNIPGCRQVYSHWKDKSGNFWIFGGFDGWGTEFNDMWRYNPSTNNWTWMSGTNILYDQGSFGSKCNLDSTNVPYSRFENRACWTDTSGNFWMFGGGVDSGRVFSIVWNDLWKYCVNTNQWAWISGDSTMNVTGNWGTKGVSNATNVPNGRGGAVSWTDNKGHLYLFGGSSKPFGQMHNDLWKYTIDPNCSVCASAVPPVASFLSSDTVLCLNDCISFTDLSFNSASWSWSFPGAQPATSSDKNPSLVCYQDTGTFEVTLIASNAFGKDTITVSNFIKVNPAPVTPTIEGMHDTLFCSTDPSYTSYQWYDSSTIINGAVNTFLVITHSGNYNMKVTNSMGCKTAVGITYTLGLNPLTDFNFDFNVYPNPAGDEINLIGNWKTGNGIITIYNVLGEKIREQQIKLNDHTAVNVKNLSAGIYLVKITTEKESLIGRFVKE